MPPTVLMVAEKPSIAHAIAAALHSNEKTAIRDEGGGGSTKGSLPCHRFTAPWRGEMAHYRVTSVAGHVFSIDFPDALQDWELVDPGQLFDAPVVKKPTKAAVVTHLRECGSGADFLVLWLDCDREGEAIAFEVIDVVSNVMSGSRRLGPDGGILRAKFSAVTPSDIRSAMASLGTPNRCEAQAVAARQELDLKVGVAFSRFQTGYFRDKYEGLDSKMLSFGPCQTPTLGFIVQRHIEIQNFVSEAFWTVEVDLFLQKDWKNTALAPINAESSIENGKLRLKWSRGRVFDGGVGQLFLARVTRPPSARALHVLRVRQRPSSRSRPQPMNTVEMLKQASRVLGIGPHQTMAIAERLYLNGLISYPRTESTAYPKSFDVRAVLEQHRSHPEWGEYATRLLEEPGRLKKPRHGHDAGDHPPITPVRCSTSSPTGKKEDNKSSYIHHRNDTQSHDNNTRGRFGPGLMGDQGRLYNLICRHFLASVSPDAQFLSTTILAATSPKVELDPLILAALRSLEIIDALPSRHMLPREGQKCIKNYTSSGKKIDKEYPEVKRGGMNLGGSPVVTTCGHNRVAHEESNEKKIKVLLRSIVAEGEEFFLSTKTLLVPGFLEILYRNGSRESDHVLPPPLKVGDRFRLHNSSTDKDHQHQWKRTVSSVDRVDWCGDAYVRLRASMTQPPSHLTESDLISVMERHGIGTDASIPTHIENVQKRNYAHLATGRSLVPSKLGLVLVQGYFCIDRDLVLPTVRRAIEIECDRIARGEVLDPTAIVERALANFKAKYYHYASEISRVDPLFEASFAIAEAAQGAPFVRCGLTNRYLHLIPTRPPRLYNPCTEDVWLLPVGGGYRLHIPEGRRCPVCNFEVLLYVLPDHRTFPLCVYCFNNPRPKEWGYQPPPLQSSFNRGGGETRGRRGVDKSISSAGVGFNAGCLECPLGDRHPIIHEVAVCGDASGNGGKGRHGGVFIAELAVPGLGVAGSSQGRRLISTRSSTTIDLPPAVKKIRLLNDDETSCWLAKNSSNEGETPESGDESHKYCRLLEVTFEEELTPLDGGYTKHIGSVIEDPLLQSLLHVKQLPTLNFSSLRGKGHRGGKGKRRPRNARDPKMSFRDF